MHSMKKLTYILVFLFSFQLAFGQTQLDTAINFSVKDIHGNNIELFPILDEGKLVVIDFFNTACGPCALYAPDFQASYEDFGENSSNVFFMTIAWGDDNNGVAYFDSIHGITAPSVSGSQGGGNQVYTDYMIGGTPTVILITPDRVIVEKHIWEPTRENLNAAIIAAGGSLVGVDEFAGQSNDPLYIYPNPSAGIANIKLELKEAADYSVEVYDLLGNKVYETGEQHFAAGDHILKVEMTGMPGGTYFIRLLNNGRQEKLARLIMLQ